MNFFSASGKDARTNDGRFFQDLLIGGNWIPAQSGKRIDVVDPSTENVITTIADADIVDAAAAIDAAAIAAGAWASTSPRDRSEILRRCFELMVSRQDELAHLISLENGKAIADARGEVLYAAEFFRWFAEEAVRISGDILVAPSGQNKIVVQHQPIGIALLITPWNFPAAMATRKIAPALAAGCTCILKPATETPLTAYAIASIMIEAGVPAGVVNVITTSSSGKVVDHMLHDPRVRKLSFTGSTEVGRKLLRAAADQVISCSMELGGNAPFIVFDDADIDAAIEGSMIAKMRNGGEACTAANRFFVQRNIFDVFGARLAARMKALRVGPGYAPETQLGPLINAQSRDRIATMVDDAVASGAHTLGADFPMPQGPGFYFPPTVISDVRPDSPLLREEIFGPVAVLLPFDTVDEVISRANATEYGLVAYVYSRDLAKALAVAERLESGMVAVNRGLVSDPAAPFGGMKQSGVGREGAHIGLLEFTETKYIAVSW